MKSTSIIVALFLLLGCSQTNLQPKAPIKSYILGAEGETYSTDCLKGLSSVTPSTIGRCAVRPASARRSFSSFRGFTIKDFSNPGSFYFDEWDNEDSGPSKISWGERYVPRRQYQDYFSDDSDLSWLFPASFFESCYGFDCAELFRYDLSRFTGRRYRHRGCSENILYAILYADSGFPGCGGPVYAPPVESAAPNTPTTSVSTAGETSFYGNGLFHAVLGTDDTIFLRQSQNSACLFANPTMLKNYFYQIRGRYPSDAEYPALVEQYVFRTGKNFHQLGIQLSGVCSF